MKKWEEMLENVPKVYDEIFRATDLVMEDLKIYEIKVKKNIKKESSQGRRKKTDLYLSGNLLFKTTNDVQIGLTKKRNKNKNIYILQDNERNERKKTDFTLKLKGEDGKNKINEYTNKGIQKIMDAKKSGEYKAFDNEFINRMKYINKDRSRYTPKNLKLPKIVMNDKDKYNLDYLDHFRYKDDMKKSFDYNRNSIVAKKI